ncbi:UNC93-like protein MFSD11 [Diabrotica virgifera virgifera]|uniref:UNC93-like protein MFSD11 n=1 Tax=Diabrotica virgifera virgifera TaxID=50390 RepID=A0ABM5KFG9_DIAVI|nr:UNC93-like protein MFSD11 [Diabrotica virgifera virgifera]
MSNIQKTIIDSIEKGNPSFEEIGYYSQAINNAFYAVFTWTVPSIINGFGAKWSMCLGALINLLFIIQFLLEKVWIVYVFCGLSGFGSALLGAAQGNYLTLNSSESTMNKHTAIFAIISSFNMIVGNTIVMWGFSSGGEISKSTRTLVLTMLAGVGTVGLIVLVFLPNHKKDEKDKDINKTSALETFLDAVKLFTTKNMLLLSVIFLYEGIATGFINGIYSSALGFTQNLHNPKQLVGLSGIFVGIGEIFAGSMITIFDKKVVALGRNVMAVTACSVHSISFILIFINLPNNSPFANTTDAAIIESNTVLAMFCSFLLGLGDCVFVNLIFSTLGTMYPENSASAFSIFQFFVGISSVINFVAAEHVGIYYQLITLFILGIVSILCNLKVDTTGKQNELMENEIKKEVSQ